jgi:hypothetical protein
MAITKQDFKHPETEYRSVPFWSWNDDLTDRELKRQISEMHQQGWGGFFMHARQGLVTPYLSQAWMQCINSCVSEAASAGIFAWLYDEDKWPSGFAGGIIPRMGPKYRQKALVMRINEDRISSFSGHYDGQKFSKLKNVSQIELLKTKNYQDTNLSFYIYTSCLGDSWFNGNSYVDLLEPEVVEAFIKNTYELYAAHVGKEFGKRVPGIFTDEPCIYFFSLPYPALPWTDKFPQHFEANNKYSILDHLPSLFFKIGNYHKIRFDYWRTITELFVESYTQKLYNWCSKRKLLLTGHFMYEDSLHDQIRWIGAAMPHYEYMHQPGIDHLGRKILSPLAAKQVSSVAHQLGKRRALVEIFGAAGQNLTFKDRKWLADWHFIHGINFINPHIALYSMRGERKRDHPPNLFFQQPWWKYNLHIENYIARLCYVLSQGERITEILVLHPISSVWSVYSPLNTEPVRQIDADFCSLMKYLLDLHLDFDLGDEGLIAKYGRVEEQKFCVGNCKYQVVLIPPSISWQKSTLTLLQEFRQNGGKILKVKPFPRLVEGEENPLLKEVLSQAIGVENEQTQIKKILERIVPAYVRIRSYKGENIGAIWCHYRRCDDKFIYFLANTDAKKGYNAVVQLPGDLKWEEWDALTGRTKEIYKVKRNGWAEIRLNFAPAGSYLLVGNSKSSSSRIAAPRGYKRINEITLSNNWTYQREAPNALVLDYCQYQLIKGNQNTQFTENSDVWHLPLPVWQAFRHIKTQPLGTRFALRFQFDIDFPLGLYRAVRLVCETPEKFQIQVNDKEVKARNDDYWCDISFKKIDISQRVKKGRNIVRIDGVLKEDTELENLYIIGDFTVKSLRNNQFTLVEEPQRLRSGNLTRQGYPFFAGAITLRQNVYMKPAKAGRIFLTIQRLKAIVTEVMVNGKTAGIIPWEPHCIEITNYLRHGNNEIAIKLVNSLHNLLGPLHHREGEVLKVAPKTFSDIEHWTDAYNLVSLGFSGAKIVIEK